nr:beta-alanine-activating enzyme [Helicoverpa armigera]
MKVKRGYYDVFVNTCARFPSNVAVRHYVDGVYKNYMYSELYGVCEYISQKLQLMLCNKGVIGLVSERNIIIPCVIAAAHKSCTTFMFVDPAQDIEAIAKDVEFTTIIIIKNNESEAKTELFGKEPDETVSVFDLIISFFSCDTIAEPHIKHTAHSYIAMTSGSTGEPKHIQVPIHCLQPNITDLTKMFNITTEDVIFFSTPLTFDPSMVEILLACMNGASLLIAPDRADVLFPQNRANSVTVWQTTPSKFLQYSNADIKNKIFCPNSTLKILALGGEPFNSIKRIRELKHFDNKTKIFTLYGVTEMSCWACVAELDLKKIQTDREVPLGSCLSETELIVEHAKENKNTGKIILVSKTRKCVILNKAKGPEELNSLKFLDTGDIGEIRNGTIYYRGRKDDVIKRFGHKVNLQMIENTIMQCPRVKTCSCVWLPKPMLLAVYFSSETLSSQELSDFLKCKLDDKHWPDKIMRVDNLPTNPHGKVSKQILSKMFEKLIGVPHSVDSLKFMFLKELKAAMSRSFTYDQIKDKDFFALGGTSFLAVSICNKLSQTCPQFSKVILPYLMTQKNTIEEILQIAKKQMSANEAKPKKRVKRSRSDSEAMGQADYLLQKKASISSNSFPVEFNVMWSHDTGKCVDASPTLFQSGFNLYVAVGSHSGKVVICDAITGTLNAELVMNTRIEAAVLCYYDNEVMPPCGIVGGYDGTVICFCLDTFKEIWRINIRAMIKSKAVCCKGKLYIAAYDGKVRCIDILTGVVKDTIIITDQAISADLVLAKREFVLLGTLSGECACVHTMTNMLSWRGTLGSPVFASPVLYDNDKYVVFAEVAGDIHCRTVEKGIKIWKYQGAKGNVFSSIYVKQIDKLKWQMVFGCHDKGVYSLMIKNFQPSLLWKTQLTSPVYSTPCGLDLRFILAASSNGKLCVLDSDNGIVLEEHSLPNETFSSPAVYGDYIFIGCRNDHLYSIRYILNY